MTIASQIAKVPVKPAFFGTLAAGAVTSILVADHVGKSDDDKKIFLTKYAEFTGGLAIASGALLVGMHIERTGGPVRMRAIVDAAEHIHTFKLSLHWGPTATVIGAGLAGLGGGLAVGAMNDAGLADRKEGKT